MSDASFFDSIPRLERFADIADPSLFTEMPDDWHVAVSDVRNSTELIRRGRYKEVNLVGASTIMALLNLQRSFSLPFVFGGDGASVCVPDSLVDETKQALRATRNMARELYGIDLRVGLIPIGFIRRSGHRVLVASCRLSPTFSQAVFSGGGLSFAEECLKDPELSQRFGVSDEGGRASADFTGLECRWQNVPSANGEIVTVIVQALGENARTQADVYREVIGRIGAIYGDDAKSHPLQEQLLSMSLGEGQLTGESGVRSYGKGRWYRLLYWWKIRWGVVLGWALMRFGYRSRNVDWGTYKRRLIRNADVRKFDDKLRQVVSGTEEQRRQLEQYLESKFASHELVYGLHAASSALITCLLFNYDDAHVHFVDADQGGYAVAAARLKERLATLA